VRQRADRYGEIGEPKTDAGTRDVPLGKFAMNTLKAWKLKKGGQGLVFSTASGRPMDYPTIWRRHYVPLFSADEGRREIKRFKFHSLRHFAISCWIAEGLPPKKVMTLAGHSDIGITYNVYGHLMPDPERDEEAMANIEASVLKF
jgi:integrase